ncbi:hypothetical protein H101_06650 [Trichophyton interdigitale H6]|nr:hypothetical protein H101_06650 [Trichophyton interdigitale H6]
MDDLQNRGNVSHQGPLWRPRSDAAGLGCYLAPRIPRNVRQPHIYCQMQYSADLCTEVDKVRSDHQIWNQIRQAVIGDPARTGSVFGGRHECHLEFELASLEGGGEKCNRPEESPSNSSRYNSEPIALTNSPQLPAPPA